MDLASDLIKGCKAASAFTGLPERTIYHLAESGKVPVIRMGKRMLLFRKSDLERAFSTEQAA